MMTQVYKKIVVQHWSEHEVLCVSKQLSNFRKTWQVPHASGRRFDFVDTPIHSLQVGFNCDLFASCAFEGSLKMPFAISLSAKKNVVIATEAAPIRKLDIVMAILLAYGGHGIRQIVE